jgi:uncharacterized protein (TIGR02598 family)
VEVVLAIGVVAFAFLAIFALIPTGMTTFRQAMDTSVGAQIAQRIAGELQETEYFTLLKSCDPDLTNLAANPYDQHGVLPRRYFDDQGNEIRVSNPDSVPVQERTQRNILYEAHVRVSRAPQIPESDGKSQSRLSTSNYVTITIQVANNPAGRALTLTAAERLIDPEVECGLSDLSCGDRPQHLST